MMTRAQFESAINEVPDGAGYSVYRLTERSEWPDIWRETEPIGDAIYDAGNKDDERHAL
jgi:hypothetical protein